MAVFTRVKVWVSNEVLTASDLNGEFNNLLNNTIPASIEDYSNDVSQMQSTSDPGGVGTESLATTLAGEIQRIRFKIKQIMNGAQWYSTPVGSLSTGGITAAALASDSVTTAKIQDGAVTQAKRASLGQQISSAGTSTGVTQVYPTMFDASNQNVTITTTGRPVFLGIVSDGTGNISFLRCLRSTSSAQIIVTFVRDSTTIATMSGGNVAIGSTEIRHIMSPGMFWHVDVPSAGTYTYKVQISNGISGSSPQAELNFCKFVAYEL